MSRFADTRWSLVLSASGEGEKSRAALEWLCRSYWSPLYGYVRSKGFDVETARDLTQGFFASLLEQDAFRHVDPSLGRFRAFLLASMNHYLSNHRAREGALKRRTDDSAFRLDLDEVERRHAEDRSSSPEALFETRWARTVLDRALRRLHDEHQAADKAELFRRLRGHLTGEEPAYDRLAAQMDMGPGALRVAVHRLRRRLGTLLRDEVAQTLADSGDVDDELKSLLRAAGRGA